VTVTMVVNLIHTQTDNRFMVLSWDYLGEPVPDEIFFWCKGR